MGRAVAGGGNATAAAIREGRRTRHGTEPIPMSSAAIAQTCDLGGRVQLEQRELGIVAANVVQR